MCRSETKNYHHVDLEADYHTETHDFLKRCSFALRPLGPKEEPLMNCHGTFQPTRLPWGPPLHTIKTTLITRPTTPPTTHKPKGKMECNSIFLQYLSNFSCPDRLAHFYYQKEYRRMQF